MNRCGGKACDIEVDVYETQSGALLDCLNVRAHDIVAAHPKLSQRQVEANFIARAIHSKSKEIDEFRALAAEPLASSSPAAAKDPKPNLMDVPEIVSRSADYQK
jgi:hypothetical protein